jgi:hypothetical protein
MTPPHPSTLGKAQRFLLRIRRIGDDPVDGQRPAGARVSRPTLEQRQKRKNTPEKPPPKLPSASDYLSPL